MQVVLEAAGQIRVAGPRRGQLALVFFTWPGFYGQDVFPVFPIFVANQESHGSAGGLAAAYSGQDLGGVGFNLHASAAAVSALTPSQFVIEELEIRVDARGQALYQSHKALAMGLSRSVEAQHNPLIIGRWWKVPLC